MFTLILPCSLQKHMKTPSSWAFRKHVFQPNDLPTLVWVLEYTGTQLECSNQQGAVFRGKFCQIPRASLQNSVAHRGLPFASKLSSILFT